jgi:hypothetical protein
VLVLVFVSQPLVGLPSQLPKPAAQLGAQTPAVQVVEPLALVQPLPQAPQCAVVLFRFVSQPLLRALLSQLPQPALQTMAHAPAEQEALPLVVLHGALQEPQWVRLVWVFVSQPFVATPSQLPQPLEQVPSVQTPLTQVSPAFGRSQSFPQPPQWVRLVLVLASQPLAALPSQSAVPGAQVRLQAQVPLLQTGVPVGQLQGLPQVPQCSVLVVTLVSQPLFGLLSQSR